MITLITASIALAGGGRGVVENEFRTYLFDSNGKCVRTEWMTDDDKCEDKTVVEEVDMSVVEERVVLFNFDKSDIRPQAIEKLNKLVEIFKHNKITHIKIVGYADKIGAEKYNKNLSSRRAESVKSYLNTRMSLKSALVEIRALGSTDAFASCDSDLSKAELVECLLPNRRVEVEIDADFHKKTTVIIPWQVRMHERELTKTKTELEKD